MMHVLMGLSEWTKNAVLRELVAKDVDAKRVGTKTELKIVFQDVTMEIWQVTRIVKLEDMGVTKIANAKVGGRAKEQCHAKPCVAMVM